MAKGGGEAQRTKQAGGAGAVKLRLEWAELPIEPTNGIVDGPTWGDVEAILRHMAKPEEPDGFVVLADAGDTMRFIQTTPTETGMALGDGTFQVEHQAGSVKAHYVLASADLEETVRLFQLWFENPASISAAAEWAPDPL
jgi:hypothetical protein